MLVGTTDLVTAMCVWCVCVCMCQWVRLRLSQSNLPLGLKEKPLFNHFDSKRPDRGIYTSMRFLQGGKHPCISKEETLFETTSSIRHENLSFNGIPGAV